MSSGELEGMMKRIDKLQSGLYIDCNGAGESEL